MSDFKIKLPLVGGKEQEFSIRAPKGRVAREYYKFKRKTAALSDDSNDRLAYEKELDAEQLMLKKVSPKERDEKRLKEIAKEREFLEKDKEKADEQYFETVDRNCYAILDTTLAYEKIDWAEADRREINGALGFFVKSVSDSSFKEEN